MSENLSTTGARRLEENIIKQIDDMKLQTQDQLHKQELTLVTELGGIKGQLQRLEDKVVTHPTICGMIKDAVSNCRRESDARIEIQKNTEMDPRMKKALVGLVVAATGVLGGIGGLVGQYLSSQ